ncbi:CMRF35-like molecule 1 isoform X2 [Hemibagrus wyckioides]|uniref:CMRF35-like molecule 1 isoform X2 n=1 Tax=Hemibagrus wyckioides TaxID=337641 RepID=UPI00266D70E6|nr:CMRF35-like molecule 1 isoform X2 [Hemibagrus wyckioides]
MATFQSILSFFQVLICVTVKSKAESVFTGTEGGSVDISCKYPDGYQYYTMYFCHDPCTYSDVLITSEMVDKFVSMGRYSAVNTPSERSFSVTIRHLRLKDSADYYCGVERWFYDILTKVKLTVNKDVTVPVSTHAPVPRQNQRSKVTEFSAATSATAVPTESTCGPVLKQNQSPHSDTKYCIIEPTEND